MNSEPKYVMDGEESYKELTPEDLSLWTDRGEPERYSFMEKELARVVLEAVRATKKQNEDHFRIHSKGLGIFCNRKEGIRRNALLVEYFGEIYP